jgi:hypothetical protein
MTVWKWCKCRACGFDGETMQFAGKGVLTCPKCKSTDAEDEDEDEDHFQARVKEMQAQYIRPDQAPGSAETRKDTGK